MKIIVFISFLLTFGFLNGQSIYNNTCGSASFLTNASVNDSTAFDITRDCRRLGGAGTMYYYYRAGGGTTSGGIMTLSGWYGTGSPALTIYEVYGPFTDQSVGCANLDPAHLLTSGSASSVQTVTHALVSGKTYILKVRVATCQGGVVINVLDVPLSGTPSDESCPNCIGSFQPETGTYVVSAWVRDASQPKTALTFTNPTIEVTSGSTTTVCSAQGDIIDGWQRIEQEVSVTSGSFTISLKSAGGECYFDDIRIFPVDGSMVTYVYDPITLRLMAELDERNYAKLYEYDEEGKLIRVKKETEEGIMTIQETRENNSGE